ncbi:unnamed protein product [[Candida] boidinii]|nr:unnamed protein product [[Candida] boidinii]
MPPRNLTNSFPSWNNNSQSSLYDDINDDPDKSSSNSDPSTDKLSQTNSDSHLVSSSDNNSANNNHNNNHNNNNNTTPNLNSNRDFVNQTRDYLPHSDDFLKDPSNNLQSYSNKFTFAPLNNANDTSNNNNNVNNIALSPPSIQFTSRYNMTPSPSTNSISPMTNDKLKYKSSTPDDLNRYPQSLSSSRFNSLTNIKDYYNQQQQPLLLQPQQLNRTSGSILQDWIQLLVQVVQGQMKNQAITI